MVQMKLHAFVMFCCVDWSIPFLPQYKTTSLQNRQCSGRFVWRIMLTLCLLIKWPTIFQMLNWGKILIL